MVSSSRSNQASTSNVTDSRIIGDNGAVAINSGGGEVYYVADEAFELAEYAMEAIADTSSRALDHNSELSRYSISTVADTVARSAERSMAMARTESAQIGEQIVKIGIPAAALIFLMMKAK